MRVFRDEELARIQAAILLLYGEQEVVVDPARAVARAERLVPNLESVLIKGAGHALSDEKPEEVTRQLLSFLK